MHEMNPDRMELARDHEEWLTDRPALVAHVGSIADRPAKRAAGQQGIGARKDGFSAKRGRMTPPRNWARTRSRRIGAGRPGFGARWEGVDWRPDRSWCSPRWNERWVRMPCLPVNQRACVAGREGRQYVTDGLLADPKGCAARRAPTFPRGKSRSPGCESPPAWTESAFARRAPVLAQRRSASGQMTSARGRWGSPAARRTSAGVRMD